jgi:hypothetical protein
MSGFDLRQAQGLQLDDERRAASRNLLSRSELHSEEQMTRHDDKKLLKPKADDQSHKAAKHIEETARFVSSTETAKDPGKVRRTKTDQTSGRRS